jgi:predicted transport protein
MERNSIKPRILMNYEALKSLRPGQRRSFRKEPFCNARSVQPRLRPVVSSRPARMSLKELEHYIAFRRLKNFACVKMLHKELQVWAKLDPSSVLLSSVLLEEGFTRDVSQIGHLGTGDLEIRIQTTADLERARPLLLRSYGGA